MLIFQSSSVHDIIIGVFIKGDIIDSTNQYIINFFFIEKCSLGNLKIVKQIPVGSYDFFSILTFFYY